MRLPAIFLLVAGLCVATEARAQGQTRAPIAAEVLRLVQEACRGSSVRGSQTQEDGSTRVAVPGSSEDVTFSDKQWEGIQQVLREHQAQDNESYRRCVETLSPVFLEAERGAGEPARGSSDEGGTQALGPVCEFENDGECDVPGLCPVGTDVADCGADLSGIDPDDIFGPGDAFEGRPLFCCDLFGNRWCPMVSGASFPGAPCYCAGVAGSGLQCY